MINAATPSGFLIEVADAKTSSVTFVIVDWEILFTNNRFLFNHISVAITLKGKFPELINSLIRFVPSTHKQSSSFEGSLSLKALNLLIRELFLLVINKFIFSMMN